VYFTTEDLLPGVYSCVLNAQSLMKTTLRKSAMFLFASIFVLVANTATVAQWVQSKGPSGWISTLAFNGANLFAGTIGGGVYLSTDYGEDWKPAGLTNDTIFSLVVSGTNLLAGTLGGGVYISSDNGASWAATGLFHRHVRSFAVSGGYIYAGTDTGVFLTTNKGASWTAAGLSNMFIGSLAVSNTFIFAGNVGPYELGVYVSSDNGVHWSAAGLSDRMILSLVVSGANLFAGTFGGGVFLSSDNGAHWTDVNNGLPSFPSVSALAVSGTNIFAGTANGVFLSTDNGENWNAADSSNDDDRVISLIVSGGYIIAVKMNGVWRQTIASALSSIAHPPDAQAHTLHWTHCNNGLTTAGDVQALAANGTDIFAGTWMNGVYRSSNNGDLWTADGGGSISMSSISSFSVNRDGVFAAEYGKDLYCTTDNGGEWTWKPSDFIHKDFKSVSLFATGSSIFVGGMSGGVARSTDNGETWTYSRLQVPYITTETDKSNPSMMSIHNYDSSDVIAFAANRNMLFAGTRNRGVYRSTDNGGSWSLNRFSDTAINVLAANGKNVFAGTDSGVYRSTDNGGTWIKSGLSATDIRALLSYGTAILAGTKTGVYFSTDNGSAWISASIGLPKAVKRNAGGINNSDEGFHWLNDGNVIALAVSGTAIYAACRFQGVYRADLESLISAGFFTKQNSSEPQTANQTHTLTAKQTQVLPQVKKHNNLSSQTNITTFAMCGKLIFAGTRDEGIYRSSNNGHTWVQADNGLPEDIIVNALLASGNLIFAGTDKGIYRSGNDGDTWMQANNGLGIIPVNAFAVNGTMMFAGTGGGAFRTTNNGDTWAPADSGLPCDTNGSCTYAENGTKIWNNFTLVVQADIHAFAVNGQNILAASTGFHKGIFISSNNGDTWAQVSDNGLAFDTWMHSSSVNGKDSTWSSVEPAHLDVKAFAVSGTNIIAASDKGMFLLANNDDTWTPMQNDLPDAGSVETFAVNGSTFFAGSISGLYRSLNNGRTWSHVNIGLPDQIWVHALAISGATLFAGTDNGIYRSSDNGKTWKQRNN